MQLVPASQNMTRSFFVKRVLRLCRFQERRVWEGDMEAYLNFNAVFYLLEVKGNQSHLVITGIISTQGDRWFEGGTCGRQALAL